MPEGKAEKPLEIVSVLIREGVRLSPGAIMPASEVQELGLGAERATVAVLERLGRDGVRVVLKSGHVISYPLVFRVIELGPVMTGEPPCPKFKVRVTAKDKDGKDITQSPGDTVVMLTDADTPPDWVGLTAEVVAVRPDAHPPLVTVDVFVPEPDAGTGQTVIVPYRRSVPANTVRKESTE